MCVYYSSVVFALGRAFIIVGSEPWRRFAPAHKLVVLMFCANGICAKQATSVLIVLCFWRQNPLQYCKEVRFGRAPYAGVTRVDTRLHGYLASINTRGGVGYAGYATVTPFGNTPVQHGIRNNASFVFSNTQLLR